MQQRLSLITGGARSGKSHFAQQLAESYQRDVLFVATAEARDADMAARIARHQRERPASWRTVEVGHSIARALHVQPPVPIVLLDCVTLWVTNLLLAEGATWDGAATELNELVAWYRATSCHCIIVTNEVGLGIVPGDELSRTFREWLGWFNQRLAAEADDVYLLVSGIAVELKQLQAQRC